MLLLKLLLLRQQALFVLLELVQTLALLFNVLLLEGANFILPGFAFLSA